MHTDNTVCEIPFAYAKQGKRAIAPIHRDLAASLIPAALARPLLPAMRLFGAFRSH